MASWPFARVGTARVSGQNSDSVLGELGDRLAAPPPARPRRHREDGVLGEQRGDVVDVAAGPRVDVLLDEAPEPVVAQRAQRLLLTPLGQALVDCLAGPLQGAVHRGDARVERVRHLACGEAEDLPQDQDRPLRGLEMLERGDERQLYRLALLVTCVGRRVAVGEPELLVGIRLDPHGFDERRPRVVRRGRRSVVDREQALVPALERVQAGVRRDPVEPGPERASPTELGQPAPRAQQRLLEDVLGVLERAEHPVAVSVELGSVLLDDPAERRLVAAPRSLEHLR